MAFEIPQGNANQFAAAHCPQCIHESGFVGLVRKERVCLLANRAGRPWPRGLAHGQRLQQSGVAGAGVGDETAVTKNFPADGIPLAPFGGASLTAILVGSMAGTEGA
jgi:hypothetical protein